MDREMEEKDSGSTNSAKGKNNPYGVDMDRQDSSVFFERVTNNVFASTYDDIKDMKGMIEYPLNKLPPNQGALFPDILCIVFLYIADKRSLLAVSATCHMWRFYSNYLPQWTSWGSRSTLYNSRLLHSVRELNISAPRIRSRDELMKEMKDAIHYRDHVVPWIRRKEILKTKLFKFSYDFLLPTVMLSLQVIAMWSIAWAIGYNSNKLASDRAIGSVTFFSLLALGIAVGLVIALIAVLCDNASKFAIDVMFAHAVRILITGWTIAFSLLVPLSLVGGRAQSADFIYGSGVTNLTNLHDKASSSCEQYYANTQVTSYLQIPAPLDSELWRVWPSNKTIPELLFSDTQCLYRLLEEVELTDSVTGKKRYEMRVNNYTCFVLIYFTPSMLQTGSMAKYDPRNDPCQEQGSTSASPSRPWIVALQGSAETIAQRLSSNVSTSSLSYRVVKYSNYFNSERETGDESRWFHHGEQNPLWNGARIYLIRPEYPETLEEGMERIKRMEQRRTLLMILASTYAGLTCVVTYVIIICNESSKKGAYPVIFVGVLALLIFSPFTSLTFAIVCISQTDYDAMSYGECTAMCDRSSGIILGVLFFIEMFVIVALVKGKK